MSLQKKNARILIIAGPTATGKTELAIRLAQRLNGEIISADSCQIYQQLDIGSGKPTQEQLRLIPHHFISTAPLDKIVTADHYARDAREVIQSIQQRGKTCLIVGGTGLWIRALVDGLAPVPAGDPKIRTELQQRLVQQGAAQLHAELQQVDPVSAAKIKMNDHLRVIRALEIWLQTGRTASSLRSEAPLLPALQALWIGLRQAREHLYRRAELRIQYWLDQGWLDEVKCLLEQNLPLDSPLFHAIGYSHLSRYLKDNMAWAQTVEWICRDTRRYIKRQLTWFGSESRMHWFDINQGEEQNSKVIEKLYSEV